MARICAALPAFRASTASATLRCECRMSIGAVFDASRFGKVWWKLLLGEVGYCSDGVEQDGASTGRVPVQGEDVFHREPFGVVAAPLPQHQNAASV